MALVDVFARDTLTNGKLYPRGARVPADVYSGRALTLRRSNGTIESVDDEGREFPEPREPEARPTTPRASSVALAQAEAAVADLRDRLEAASAELELLQRGTTKSDGFPERENISYGDSSPLDAEPDEQSEEQQGPQTSQGQHVMSGVGTRAGTAPVEQQPQAPMSIGAAPATNDDEGVPANLPEHLR